MGQRIFGVKELMIDGVVYLAKSVPSYSLGGDKHESVMGQDRRHGSKVTRIPAYLEVTITDAGQGFDVRALTHLTDCTVTLSLESGKTFKMGHADYCGEGKISPEEGEIEAKFECDPENAEEI
jgi:hypothetical protein